MEIFRNMENSIGIHNSGVQMIQYYKEYFQEHHTFPRFSQVLLEIRTDCNRKCSFCPHAFTQREFKEIEWEVFEKIIQNLVHLGFSGRIAFFINNEPLLDKRLLKMITYARKASGRFFLDVNTNGLLLTVDLVDKFFSAGLDNINIDDYRSDRDQFPDKWSPNVQKVVTAYKDNPKLHYYPRRTDEVLSNRAGNVPRNKRKSSTKAFCSYPFRKLAISPYGDVILCCADYLHEVKFGNVMNENLEDIWHSEAMNSYRFMLLEQERKFFCKDCDDYQYEFIPEKHNWRQWFRTFGSKIVALKK